MKSSKTVRVLEIGCGEGRVLMQLRRLFPSIELYGINKEPWQAMKGQKSLLTTATHYKIFKKSELKKLKPVLPKIYFYDAEKLRFRDNFFDLIISQASIHYIRRKDRLLEDVWRVLKKGGVALLHFDSYKKKYPRFMQQDAPRFVVYKNKRIVPLSAIVKNLRRKGFDIRLKRKYNAQLKFMGVNMFIRKNSGRKLRLNLKFEEGCSFDLKRFRRRKNDDIFFGYRSVFRA